MIKINEKHPSIYFSIAAHTLCHFFILILPTVALFIENSFNMTFGEVIALSIPATVMFGVCALPAGWLADKWSQAGMIAIFFIGTGLASIITGFSTSPFSMMIGLTLIGTFAAIYHPVGSAWIIQNAVNKGKTLAINSWAGNFGVALTAIITTALAATLSWRYAFIVPGVFSIAIGIVLVYFIATNKIIDKPIVQKQQNNLKDKKSSKSSMARAVLILSIAMIGTGLIYQAISVSIPKLFNMQLSQLAEDYSLSVGGLISIAYLIAGTSHLFGGYLIDKYSSKRVYLFFYGMQVPFFIFAASTQNIYFLIIMISAMFLHIGASPAEKILISEYAPSNRKATTFGARFMLGVGIGALGTPLVGIIHDFSGGFYWVFIVVALIALTVFFFSLFLPVEKQETETLSSDVSINAQAIKA